MRKIGLASDHAGYVMKCFVKNYLEEKGFFVIDYGCSSTDSCDYPDYAHLLGYSIEKELVNLGFVFCGSGNGINMTINKHKNIRSALCWNKEIAKLARNHNNANVCSFPSRFISQSDCLAIVDIFLNEDFEGGRHFNRIIKIPLI